jgi:uncharacterized membrane protein YbhN (UPF0104 family)
VNLTVALVVAGILISADIVIRAVRLRVLLGPTQAPSFLDSVAVNAYGDAASAVTPARLGGEPARFVGLKAAQIRTPAAVIVLGAERVVDLSLVAVVTLASLGVLGARGFDDVIALARGIFASETLPWLAGVVVLMIVAGVVAYRMRHRFPPVVEQSLREAWAETRRLSVGTIAWASVLTTCSMLARVALLPVLLAAYVPIDNVASVLVGSFALIYSQLLLPTPAGVGGVELGFVTALAPTLPAGDVASLLVIWRVFSLGIPAGLGGALLLRNVVRRRVREGT